MTARDHDPSLAEPCAARRRRPSGLEMLLLAAAVALAVPLAGCGLVGKADGTGHAAVGRTLPGLELQALTGDAKDVTLKDLAGKVAVINFFGTWCPPCMAEFPEIASLKQRLGDKPNVQLLLVSCSQDNTTDMGDLRMDTIAFLVGGQFKVPTYNDEHAQTRRNIAMMLGEDRFAYPTTIVLDQTGVVRGLWIGYTAGIGDKLKTLVDELTK